jgi:hypothetical protein
MLRVALFLIWHFTSPLLVLLLLVSYCNRVNPDFRAFNGGQQREARTYDTGPLFHLKFVTSSALH